MYTLVDLLVIILLGVTECSVLDYVDPFIGTGGEGFGAGSHNPGAQVPFGILRLGPDTRSSAVNLPFEHYGGYSYGDNKIAAFSHTHLVGAGVGDLGNFGLMPFATSNSDLSTVVKDHLVSFDHSEEFASPGRYAVRLPDVAHVRLAASSTHAGSHQYTFNSTETTCGVLLDVCHTAMGDGDKVCSAAVVNVTLTSATHVDISASMSMSGSLTERAPKGGVTVYFAAQLNRTGMQLFQWGDGKGSKGVLLYESCNSINSSAVHLNVAVSFISLRHARSNLIVQSHGASEASSREMWESALSRFAVSSTNSTSPASHDILLTKFYTAAYHVHLAPSIFDEHGGHYRAFGGGVNASVRTVGDLPSDRRRHAYTDMSIWDIHRTQLPLLSLSLSETYEDVLSSLQFMAMQGSGDIPRWPLLNIYTGCMIGSHAWVVFAEAVQKNQTRGLNMSLILESMILGATTERPHSGRTAVDEYLNLGYVPNEASKTSASLTLAYAFDDSAVATVADALGRHEEARVFRNRSRSAYKHLWSKDRNLLCPKSEQTQKVICPLDDALPYPFESRYTEGDALQWLWFVPHDPSGLVSLFPSNETFVAKLQDFFRDGMPVKMGGKWAFGTTLANAWYWPGNEPDILAPWLFPFAGAQYQNYTNYWTRWLVDQAYSLGADGLPGNDDFGTLSAWLIWSTLGIYPMAGTSRFVVGAPRFESVCIERDVGRLCVLGHNVTKANHTHVSKCLLNGETLEMPFFEWSDLAAKPNSTLEFFMTDVPGKWG